MLDRNDRRLNAVVGKSALCGCKPGGTIGFAKPKVQQQRSDGFNEEVANLDLLADPTSVFKKPFISTSLVSERNFDPYSSVGLILKPKLSNLVAAADSDMGVPHLRLGKLTPSEIAAKVLEYHSEYKLAPPDKLLAENNTHNELLLTGVSESGENVEATGLFVMTDGEGRPLVGELTWQKLKLAAQKFNLPLVRVVVPDATKFADKPISAQVGSTSIVEVTLVKDGILHKLYVYDALDSFQSFNWKYVAWNNGKIVTSKESFETLKANMEIAAKGDSKIGVALDAMTKMPANTGLE